tara:strand:- start:866 stop:1240 length:375 start_codon:yes stop_codon:yes gene_type:complete
MFRFMAAYDQEAPGERVDTLCAGIGSNASTLRDPAAATLAELARSLDRRVLPASQCRIDARATTLGGAAARILFVEKQSQPGPAHYGFRAGYYESRPAEATGAYRVDRVAGDWLITPAGPAAGA